jgi:hypothetical protein
MPISKYCSLLTKLDTYLLFYFITFKGFSNNKFNDNQQRGRCDEFIGL